MKPELTKLLGPKLTAVYEMREQGKTFKAIGQAFGVCSNRGRLMFLEACRKIEEFNANKWDVGLSTRVRTALWNANITNREGVAMAYRDGRLLKFRNYGWKCHNEVERWLGLPETKRP